jgi:phosphoglycolate phosphatase-like HAD superfamily hydrolase
VTTTIAAARTAKLVLWDFDGVIKESVDVKTRAFMRLFEPFGQAVVERVRAHHEANGGMSRLDKIPIYLEFSGEQPSAPRVRELCDRFSELVRQAVIDAPWVPGAETWLRRNTYEQLFVLVSATPQAELEDIVSALALRQCFADVFGAPTSKAEAVRLSLERYGVAPDDAVLIGDAGADRDAAAGAQVPFVLRRHASNGGVFADYRGPSVRDLTEL